MKQYLLNFAMAAMLTFGAGVMAEAGVWQTASADVDGDGIMETVQCIIGEPGDLSIPYQYDPHCFIYAYNVPRVGVGLAQIREVVSLNGGRILDTGLPTMVNNALVYQNALYQDKQTAGINGSAVTQWSQDNIVLERSVHFTNQRALITYRVYDSGQLLGKGRIIVIWNQGYNTPTAACDYVDAQWPIYKAAYADSFPGTGQPADYSLSVSYAFDDYLQVRSNEYLWGWDDGGYGVSATVFGMGSLPGPDSLYLTGYSGSCGQRANIRWGLREISSTIAANVRIRPRTINLNSNGVFTAFVTLPSPHDINSIIASSVECAGVPALSGFVNEEGEFVAKFNRSDLPNLPDGLNVLEVAGQLSDGSSFAGSDEVTIISKGHKKTLNVEKAIVRITPNPFVTSTTISCEPGNLSVKQGTIKIYNLTGQMVRVLGNQTGDDGRFQVNWDGKDGDNRILPSGIYLYRLESPEITKSGRIYLIR